MPETGLTCPLCQQPATIEHLQASPECLTAVQSLCGLYRVAKRKTVGRSTGRRVQIVPCPRCGQLVTKTQARRGHGCNPVAKQV